MSNKPKWKVGDVRVFELAEVSPTTVLSGHGQDRIRPLAWPFRPTLKKKRAGLTGRGMMEVLASRVFSVGEVVILKCIRVSDGSTGHWEFTTWEEVPNDE